jgi:hypothetical protein
MQIVTSAHLEQSKVKKRFKYCRNSTGMRLTAKVVIILRNFGARFF